MRYYIWGGLLLAVEIIFVVHAAKRGRHNWIYIIMFFPVAGCMAYALTYLIPTMRVSSSLEDTGDKIVRKIAPTRRLIKLKNQLEFSDTLKNKQLLAQEYMNLGAYEHAATLYESCLEGAYEDDPYIMMDFGRALFMNGSHEEARETLLKIKKEHPNFIQKKETSLLLARTYEELNEIDRALAEYKSVAGIYPGEEPRCRYAMLLNKSGRREEAEKMFNEILFGSRSNPRYYRREQRQWISLARQHLKLFQDQG